MMQKIVPQKIFDKKVTIMQFVKPICDNSIIHCRWSHVLMQGISCMSLCFVLHFIRFLIYHQRVHAYCLIVFKRIADGDMALTPWKGGCADRLSQASAFICQICGKEMIITNCVMILAKVNRVINTLVAVPITSINAVYDRLYHYTQLLLSLGGEGRSHWRDENCSRGCMILIVWKFLE